jgi:hypothetical protein
MNWIYLFYFVFFIGIYVTSQLWKIKDANGKAVNEDKNVHDYYLRDWLRIGMGLGLWEILGTVIVNTLQTHVPEGETIEQLDKLVAGVRLLTRSSRFIGTFTTMT